MLHFKKPLLVIALLIAISILLPLFAFPFSISFINLAASIVVLYIIFSLVISLIVHGAVKNEIELKPIVYVLCLVFSHDFIGAVISFYLPLTASTPHQFYLPDITISGLKILFVTAIASTTYSSFNFSFKKNK